MISQLRFSLLAACLLLVSTLSLAQDRFAWKEGQSAGYNYRYVANDPMETRFYTLKNGLTVILSPTDKDPRMQVYIAVKAGSKTDPATHTGLAHYLEHMLFKGTRQFGSLDWSKEQPLLEQIDALYEQYNQSKDEDRRRAIYRQIDSVSGLASRYAIANEYDKMMTEMGVQGTNAFTSNEMTVYTEDVPANAIDKFLMVQAERFRDPVFRIFHTELEAVYEEKNRTLDNDPRKVYETMMAQLFQKHNYGLQTTIGTIEHLKNPSLLEIRKYFNNYYVPNNMGIIVSGDFNPDELIRKIDEAFAYMQPKPVPEYKFEPEQPITSPIVREVHGPDAEFIAIGYRLPGIHDKDMILADLVGQVLTNGKAGLMDLNLVKKQKLLRASAYTNIMIDYGMLMLQGAPTQGQSLDEVRNLMLGEIENLKQGKFDDDLLTSIINNAKKYLMQQNEKYSNRASALMYTFVMEDDWRNNVAYTDIISRITRQDIIDYANRYLGNNYVAVYKRQGEDKSIVKVEKPPITPVETNAGKQSAFVQKIAGMPVSETKPVWLDYEKDIQRGKVGPATVLYVPNTENGLFRMTYRIEAGSWNDKRLPVAANYLQFLGTPTMTAEQISREFYKLASSFNVSSSGEFTYVTLEGLQENFPRAVALLEDLLANAQPDAEALKALKARIAKSRTDAKKNKGAIMQGLVSYARYGAENPFNYVLSDEELEALTADELVQLVKQLNSYPHRIIYYGPMKLNELTASLNKAHQLPASFAETVPAKKFQFRNQESNEVFFTDYDMVQSEIRWVRNIPGYDPAMQAQIDLFNNYFGGNMGSIVFQTIRESKALAYSTSAYFVTPEKKEDPYYLSAYVGSQSDKLSEAVAAMNELLTELPEVKSGLASARSAIRKDIETERISKDGIIMHYLSAERRGLTTDYRKAIYEEALNLDYAELNNFHKKYISGKPYSYTVVASEDKIDMEALNRLGTLNKLTKEQLFGY